MRDAVQLDVPADARFFRLVTACVAELIAVAPAVGDAHATSHDLQLAVQELCANVADHAYQGQGGRLQVSLLLQDGCAVVELFDSGRAFEDTPRAGPIEGELPERGQGLSLIHALVDEVGYTRHNDRNHWRLVKRLL